MINITKKGKEYIEECKKYKINENDFLIKRIVYDSKDEK